MFRVLMVLVKETVYSIKDYLMVVTGTIHIMLNSTDKLFWVSPNRE